MGKEPSFQYYPKDWRADAVFGCSLAARGLWHEMMNMMHATERYGYLSQNGQPIPDEVIARYCGCSLQDYLPLLDELARAGVPSRTSNGTLFSRRMVRDAKQRSDWRKQKQNQRDRKVSAPCPQNVRSMSVPSSSPSPSASAIPIQREKKESSPPEFGPFWDAYPRKEKRLNAVKEFVRQGCAQILGEVLAGLTLWKKCEQWRDVQYVPLPSTWLDGQMWKETPCTNKPRGPSLEEQRIALEKKAGIHGY